MFTGTEVTNEEPRSGQPAYRPSFYPSISLLQRQCMAPNTNQQSGASHLHQSARFVATAVSIWCHDTVKSLFLHWWDDFAGGQCTRPWLWTAYLQVNNSNYWSAPLPGSLWVTESLHKAWHWSQGMEAVWMVELITLRNEFHCKADRSYKQAISLAPNNTTVAILPNFGSPRRFTCVLFNDAWNTPQFVVRPKTIFSSAV
jgi:hypothetical protein